MRHYRTSAFPYMFFGIVFHALLMGRVHGQTVEFVSDINPGGDGSPYGFIELGGSLLFGAVDADGNELWRTDGTEAGTVQVKDIKPTGSSNPMNFVC